MTKILLIGSGAREHAIARAIARSPQAIELYCYGVSLNPGISELVETYAIGDINVVSEVVAFAKEQAIDFAIIGPEAPLAMGIVDCLARIGIPSVGPTQQLAQIETSKAFARDLLTRYNVPGIPRYQVFTTLEGVETFIATLNTTVANNFVIKADGLMGGKGVKVAGEHLHSIEEALAYCEVLVDKKQQFVIEERFIGQEFSLISFSDGTHLAHLPVVQDHKRAFEGDTGPNTGGMGSYSMPDHRLPFLSDADVVAAQRINEATVGAMREAFDEPYQGILYGGFILTADGVKLIEYNARLGDPEALNLLSLLESDFVAICQAIINGTLSQDLVHCTKRATVCKYAVPQGYPDQPIRHQAIDLSGIKDRENLYFSSVEQHEDELHLLGSRAVAYVGIADTLVEAEQIAEAEISRIRGPVFHRADIGTESLLQKQLERVLHHRETEMVKDG